MNSKSPIMVTPKYFWESRTNIYNGIKTGLGVVIGVATFVLAAQHAGTLPFEISDKWLAFILSAAVAADGAFGMWLRTQTDAPIVSKEP